MLSTYANGAGRAWPSIVELADANSRSESTIRRALRELARVELVEIEHRRGRGRTNGYRLVLPVKPVTGDRFSDNGKPVVGEPFSRIKPVVGDTRKDELLEEPRARARAEETAELARAARAEFLRRIDR